MDRLANQVVVLRWDGFFQYVFGADALGEPGSIAVSRDNLVFVSDNFKYTVKVYRVQRTGDRRRGTKGANILLAAKIGGVGAVPVSFNGIAGLSVAGNVLFVADSLNA